MNTLICGDVIDVLRTLPEKSVQTCVTSPPYYRLRDYGKENQIGMESSPEQFVQKLSQVFCEVWRVLKDDGTLWLNLGDSYASQGGGQVVQTRNSNRSGGSDTQNKGLSRTAPSGLKIKAKDLIGIPWMVAFALRADGWYLRSDIIWAKPNPMPESIKDRPTRSHEYIFLLSKSAKYYYDPSAISEPAKYPKDLRAPKGSAGAWKLDGRPADNNKGRLRKQDNTGNPTYAGFNKRWKDSLVIGQTQDGHRGYVNPDGSLRVTIKDGIPMRNKRDVWTISPKPYKEAHFATFPPDLITPCILAGSREGDTVLDPFVGSGTTLLVASQYNRNGIGIDLNQGYIDLAEKRLA